MSTGPIATISDGESPEMWMGKLEACRQAADAAVGAVVIDEGVPDHSENGGGAAVPEPSAVIFDDDSD